MVLESFAGFSPDLADTARAFFDDQRIDAPVRPGKRGGAFCSYTVPSAAPYVMLNYTARRRDVLTLAHELGHGVHAALARPAGRVPLRDAAHPRRDRQRVRRDARVRPPARGVADAGVAARTARREHRGLDRHRLPPGGDEPLRAPRPHRAARAGRALARPDRRAVGGVAGGAARRRRRGHRGLPQLVVLRPALHQLAGLRLRVRLRPAAGPRGLRRATRRRARLRARLPRAAVARAGRCRRRSSARIVGIDLADPGFWDRGLDLVERQLEDAEAAARESGRVS